MYNSQIYDIINQDKNYFGESQIILNIIKSHIPHATSMKSVMDVKFCQFAWADVKQIIKLEKIKNMMLVA